MSGTQPLVKGEIIDLLARAEINGLKEDVHNLSRKVDGLASKGDIAALTATIANISDKQDSASQPKYALLVSVMTLGMLILTALGSQALSPVKENQVDIKETVRLLSSQVVYERRYEANLDAMNKRVDMLTHDADRIDVAQERWRNYDMQIQAFRADVDRRFAEDQRQHDRIFSKLEKTEQK